MFPREDYKILEDYKQTSSILKASLCGKQRWELTEGAQENLGEGLRGIQHGGVGRGYCHGCVWASLNPYSFFCQQCSEFTWECPLPSPSPALQGGPPPPGHRCWTTSTPSRLVQKWGHAPNLARESGPGLLFKFLGRSSSVLLSWTLRGRGPGDLGGHLAGSLRIQTPVEEAGTWRGGRAGEPGSKQS